ncbi:MAG: sigma-70 family RNA polymerase sigma factor [Gemmataceae bacterium]
MAEADWKTSLTLLRRLRRSPADEAAWGAFVERYGRLIYRWCRRWGLQAADAEDVTQTVFVELARQMRSFRYDEAGSFRGWLRVVARRAWGRFLEGRQRDAATGLEGVLQEAACDDLLRELEVESDRELLELASRAVQARVRPHTWEAFRLLAVEGRSGADAARELNMQPGAVFVARSKVQKMLRREIERLAKEAE